MEYILVSLSLAVFIQIVFFFFAATLKTDKFTDLSYGLSFIIITIILLLDREYNLSKGIMASMVIFWGVRLALYLFIRILKIKRDKRFDDKRDDLIKFAKFWFFQAISVWMIMLPVASYMYLVEKDLSFGLLEILGIAIWWIGLWIETIADMQKFTFKNKLENKGKWISSGLWKYSRHPNYFGEMLCWWGIYIFALPVLGGVYYLTVFGPLYITILLLFVSGIPLLEKKYDEKYGSNEEYKKYRRNTSLLIPFFPKK